LEEHKGDEVPQINESSIFLQGLSSEVIADKFKSLVQLQALTWKRDRHDLFDNEATNKEESKFTIRKSGKMSRHNDQTFLSNNKTELTEADQHDLALITKDGKGRYWIDHAVKQGTEEESVNRLWLLARFLEDENGKRDYRIEKFDTIRVGRVRLRVKDFRCNGQ
jgi:hypothetical protein